MGRGVEMFSTWSAIALASKIPTQMGSTRSPSLALRRTMGVFVTGSTMRPLIVISICMLGYCPPNTVRSRALDADWYRAPDPLRRAR